MFGSGGAHYAYDALDNLTHVVAPGRDHWYCYDASWRLTNVKTGGCGGSTVIGLGYDVQGNVSNKNGTAGGVYTFDMGNRLRRAQMGNLVTGYLYDGHGRRVRDYNTASKYSVYDAGGQLVFARDLRQNTQAWYLSLGSSLVAIRERDVATGVSQYRYQHTDALGSPVAVTDQNRNVIERSEYEPYGRLLNRPLADGPGFAGHVSDAATGLSYMQQRYYDPTIGRFLSVDPVTADTTTGWNFNRYNYAANNPYKFKDPDGRIIDTLIDAAFTIYDTGRFLGAVAAYGAGKISDNEALTNAGWEGVKETSGAVAVDAAAAAVPFVSVPMVKTGEHAIEAARAAEKAAQGPRLARGKLREQVLDKGRQADGSVTCKYCGKPTATTSDHVVPYSKGGPTKIDNLEPACTSCNSSKGNKELGKDWIPPKDRERQ